MTITIDFSDILSLQENLNTFKEILPTEVNQLAQNIKTSVTLRVVNRGIGLDGSIMKKYSPKYAKYKQRKGRDTSYRNLQFTGNMMQAMDVNQVSNTKHTIYFNSAFESKKATWNDNLTPWFGISPFENDVIDDWVNDLINKVSL